MLWATSWCRFLHQKRWDNDQPTNLSGLRDFTKQKRRIYIQRPLTMGCGTWRCTHMHTYVCNIFIAHQYHRFVISNLVITFPALIYFQRDAGPLFQLYLHNLIYIYILLRVAWISPSQSHKGQFLRLVCWRLASAQEVARDYGDVSGARLSCCRLFWSILHLEGGAGCQQYAGRHVSTNTAVLNDVGGIDGGFYAVSGVCADKGSQSATVDDFAHLWSLGNLEEWRVVHPGLLTLLHYCCGSNKRKFRSLYFRVTEFQSKEVSQQRSLTARSLTAKKSHSKEVPQQISQQRSLTAKKSHSKEVSQQRSLTAKKCDSKEVPKQRSLTARMTRKEMRTIDINDEPLSWEWIRWGEMRWDDIGQDEVRWNEMKWDEVRWKWERIQPWKEMMAESKVKRWLLRSMEGLAAPYRHRLCYRLEAFQFWNFRPPACPVLLGYTLL